MQRGRPIAQHSRLLIGLTLSLAFLSAQPTTDNRAFWRAIAQNHYTVPAGAPLVPLVQELSGYLASTDPELRDDLAYSILANWIIRQRQLTGQELIALSDQWQNNLRIGIGEPGSDTVFVRSFSALCLASLAERELKTPFLGEERYRALLQNALTYLREERDLRGFDPVKGWIHASAHTADLLNALARNTFLKTDDQPLLLDALAKRLSSANEIFTYGEQDRLAAVASELAMRPDFQAAAFKKWLADLNTADQQVWKDSPPKLALLRTFENDTYFLRALAVYLETDSASPAVTETRAAVRQALRNR